MGRVARALVVHELLERLRDRWVLVISVLFALLASAVSLYGRTTESSASALTGPSLVTLAGLFVPLVALVLSHDAIVGERERNTLGLLLSLPVRRYEIVLAKYLGRGLALVVAVSVGIGAAVAVSPPGERHILASLLGPTVLLGLAFLSIGMLLSSLATRQVVAASLVVVTWFLLVFFYDLGLVGLLAATEGQISQDVVAMLVVGNPAGLYRLSLMETLLGPQVLESLGMTVRLPSSAGVLGLWALWVLGPTSLSGLLLSSRRVLQ